MKELLNKRITSQAELEEVLKKNNLKLYINYNANIHDTLELYPILKQFVEEDFSFKFFFFED